MQCEIGQCMEREMQEKIQELWADVFVRALTSEERRISVA